MTTFIKAKLSMPDRQTNGNYQHKVTTHSIFNGYLEKSLKNFRVYLFHFILLWDRKEAKYGRTYLYFKTWLLRLFAHKMCVVLKISKV